MRKQVLVAISILLAVLGSTDPAAAQPAAQDPAAAGEAAPAVPRPEEADAARATAAEPAGDAAPAVPAVTRPAPAVTRPAPPVMSPAPLVMPPAPSFGPPSEQAPRPAVTVEGTPRSEAVALGLSLGGTAVSWGLMLAGVGGSGDLSAVGLVGSFLAPSSGHWYRGAVLTRGMGVRAVGLIVFAYGFVKAIGCESSCDRNTEELLLLGGLAIYLGGTIDDIVMAPLRVRQQNRRRQQVQLAPMVAPQAAGVALGGRF